MLGGMTVTESSSRTLERRAELLHQLLTDDGFQVSLDEARDMILADAAERLRKKVSEKG